MSNENEVDSSLSNDTAITGHSDRELVVTRTFDAPVAVVFDAWSVPERFKRWWIPKSIDLTLLSCEMDIRTGGTYRLVFQHPSSDQPMAFFGTYQDVTPRERLVWTNEESSAGAVTTVTFEESDGKTRVTLHERYPTTADRDDALAGSATALPEQFAQLDALLKTS